jgi:hypothetical protein
MRIASLVFAITFSSAFVFGCSKHDSDATPPAPSASSTTESTPDPSASGEHHRHHHHDGGFGRWRRDHGGDFPAPSGSEPNPMP